MCFEVHSRILTYISISVFTIFIYMIITLKNSPLQGLIQLYDNCVQYATQHTIPLYCTCVTNLLKYYSIWYFPAVKYSFQFENEKIIYEMSSFPANFLSLFPERNFGDGVYLVVFISSLLLSLFPLFCPHPALLTSPRLQETAERL